MEGFVVVWEEESGVSRLRWSAPGKTCGADYLEKKTRVRKKAIRW